jgi:Mg/Co/Ni transporter MgtE
MNTDHGLSLAYLDRHPGAAAAVLERVAAADAASLLAAATPAVAARALGTMAPLAASACLLALSQDIAARILAAMPPAIAAALLRRAPADRAERLLGAVPDAEVRALRRLLHYRESQVGAMVDPGVPGLPADQHAADALAWLRTHRDRTESALFLVDRAQKLTGVLPLHALLGAQDTARLESIGQPVSVRLAAAASLVSALANPVWRELPVVPVVDEGGIYLGALRHGMLEHLADADRTRPSSTTPVQTLISLGELYWSGTGRLMAAVAAAIARRQQAGSRPPTSPTGSNDHGGPRASR